MVAEDALVAIRLGLDGSDADAARRHLVKTAAHQVGMATHQMVEARQLAAVSQWRAVAPVEVLHLLRRKVFEPDLRAYVEGRLVDIRDEEVRFGGIGDRQSESGPWTAR